MTIKSKGNPQISGDLGLPTFSSGARSPAAAQSVRVSQPGDSGASEKQSLGKAGWLFRNLNLAAIICTRCGKRRPP